jgi:hypothetical protein
MTTFKPWASQPGHIEDGRIPPIIDLGTTFRIDVTLNSPPDPSEAIISL